MAENLDSLSVMWETLKPEVGDREPRHSTGGIGRQQRSGLKISEHSSKYFFELTLEGKEKWICTLFGPGNLPPAICLS